MDNKLENQRELLDSILKKKEDLENRIELLKQNSEVKKYIDSTTKLSEVTSLYEKQYKEHIITCCRCCDHLIVVSGSEYDSGEGRRYYSYGCLKCGADTNIFDYPLTVSTIEDEAYMYYLSHYYMFNYTNTDLYYSNRIDFLEARKQFLKYRKEYKDLSDEMIIEIMKEPKKLSKTITLNKK